MWILPSEDVADYYSVGKERIIWGYHAITDSEKLNIKNYVLLVKASLKPLEEAANLIIKREIEPLADQIGVTLECSSYVHGAFDWLILFSAKDIKNAKKFCHLVGVTYQDYVADMMLLEEMFPMKRCGIPNPEMKRLKEFV